VSSCVTFLAGEGTSLRTGHASQARTFEQGPPRLGRKSVFQSLQELADSEDTIQQQQGQRARSPEERNREHDRAAVHRWVVADSFSPLKSNSVAAAVELAVVCSIGSRSTGRDESTYGAIPCPAVSVAH